VHFVTTAHQLAWMEHPAIWLCESCAILWLVLRAVRSPVVRTGVLLMLCGLGMNALVTDTNAGSMPVIGMPYTVRPASPMWQGATLQTRLPLSADQARLGLFGIGDIALLFGGILIVAICLRRTFERARTTRLDIDDIVATLGGRLSRLSFQTPRMGSPRLRMNLPEKCGDSSIHRSKMPDYPGPHKIVVLAGLAGINIELRYARPEIPKFSPHAKPSEDPHIQAQTGL